MPPWFTGLLLVLIARDSGAVILLGVSSNQLSSLPSDLAGPGGLCETPEAPQAVTG